MTDQWPAVNELVHCLRGGVWYPARVTLVRDHEFVAWINAFGMGVAIRRQEPETWAMSPRYARIQDRCAASAPGGYYATATHDFVRLERVAEYTERGTPDIVEMPAWVFHELSLALITQALDRRAQIDMMRLATETP